MLVDIEEVIKEGAILDKPYEDKYNRHKYDIPIMHSIGMSCHFLIVKLLKEYWWDDSHRFVYRHQCMYDHAICPKRYGASFLKCDMSVYLHEIYGLKSYRHVKKYAELFNIVLIRKYKDRHDYLSKYTYI